MIGDKGFKSIPNHTRDVRVLKVFFVLGELGEDGKAVFYR